MTHVHSVTDAVNFCTSIVICVGAVIATDNRTDLLVATVNENFLAPASISPALLALLDES